MNSVDEARLKRLEISITEPWRDIISGCRTIGQILDIGDGQQRWRLLQLTFEAKSPNLTFSLDENPSAITMEFGPIRAEPRNLLWNWKYPNDRQLGNSLSPTTSFSDIN